MRQNLILKVCIKHAPDAVLNSNNKLHDKLLCPIIVKPSEAHCNKVPMHDVQESIHLENKPLIKE